MHDVSLQPLLRQPSPFNFLLPPVALLALAFSAGLLALMLIGLALPATGLLLWVVACAALPQALRPQRAFAMALLAGATGSALLLLLIGDIAPSRAVQLHLFALLGVEVGLFWQRYRALGNEAEQLRDWLALRDAIASGLWQLGEVGLELLDGDGRPLSASPAALALWQADSEAALYRVGWLERWGQGARNPARQGWLEMQSSGSARFEASARTFGGERRQFAVTLRALTLPSGVRAVLSSCRDLTDERAQRGVLAAKSAELEQLLDAIDEGFCVIGRDWTLRYLNRRGATLLQVERDALIGRSIWEIAPAAQLNDEPEVLRRAMQLGEAGELRVYHPQLQRWLFIRITPAADGITALFRDITVEVEAAREHSEHLARLQVVQELAGVAGWQFDFGNGQLRLSPKALELLELPECPGSEHKRRLLQQLHPSDRMPLVEGLAACAKAGSDLLLDVTTRRLDADHPGRVRHLRWLARRAEGRANGDCYLVGAVQDVTAAVEAREHWEFLRTVIDVLPSDVCVVDQRGEVVALNRCSERRQRFERCFGDLDVGNNLLRLLASIDDPERAVVQLQRQLADLLGGHSDRFDLEYVLRIDDAERWFSTRASLLQSAGRRFAVLCHDDITERHTHEERLYRAANFDQLTALPNRSALFQQLAQQCVDQQPFALLSIDLDRFQNFNDSFGVYATDQLLRQVVRRLEADLPAGAQLYRLGSDEFVALLPGDSSSQAVAELLMAALANRFELEQTDVFVSASFGAAEFPQDGSDGDSVLRAAGAALAQVKSAGRNGYCRFEPGQQVATRAQLQLEAELHAALERGEFELFYQGKYRLASSSAGDALEGSEALLRWRSPTRGLVSPAEFIPLLEQNGLIGPVGEWVLREACRQLAQWQCDSGLWLSVAVNVSPLQLANPDFAANARAIRDAAAIPPGLIELEITESLLMRDIERGAELVRELREAGFRVALDDFGTGYSSLSYLRSLALDTLKIDRSFIAGLDADGGREIVAGVINIARALHMQVVAEGVETDTQREILRGLGCDNVQGFLFSRPLPAVGFEALALPCSGSGCDAVLRQRCRTAPCTRWQQPLAVDSN